MITSVLLLVTTFLFIYGWKINYYLDLILIFSFMLVLYYSIVLSDKYQKRIIVVTFMLAILSIYALLITMLNGAVDLEVSLRSIRAMVNFLGAAALVYILHTRYGHKFKEKLIIFIFISVVIHGVIMIIMYLNEDIRLAIYQLTDAYAYVNLNSPFLLGLRITGLTYGLSQTSVVQMFGLILIPFILNYYWKRSFLYKIMLILSVVTIIISMLLSGLSGLLILFITFPLLLICIKIFQGKLTINQRLIFNAIRLTLLLIIFILTINLTVTYSPDHFISYNVKRSYEVINFFTELGDIPTIDSLSRMIFLPENTFQFIFGTSQFARGGVLGSVSSDIGYIRMIFAIGIVGSLLMIIPFIYALYQALQLRKYEEYFSATTFIILLSSLILNFKEVALLTRNQWSIQSLLICATILIYYQHKQKRLEVADNSEQ